MENEFGECGWFELFGLDIVYVIECVEFVELIILESWI